VTLNKETPFHSIVVPVYNSEELLPELYRRLVSVMEQIGEPFEMIFVEDCSRDLSWHVVRDLAEKDSRVTAIQLMKNSGQGNATLCGLAEAHGRFVITLDDDLQNPPEEIPPMIQRLVANDDLDVVIGSPQEKRHNLIRRIGSSFINRMNSWFLDKDLKLRFTGFRVMRRQVVEALLDMQVPYPALGPMIISATRRIENLTVRHDPRLQGQSGYNLRRIIRQAISNFIGYSILPLHLLAIIGALGITASILTGSYFLFRYFFVGITVPGWMTLTLLLVALSGFNFFAFAVIGEYILRITQVSTRTSRTIVRTVISKTKRDWRPRNQ
jgi:polyisoprenyl-phosphate glycosyltransferase